MNWGEITGMVHTPYTCEYPYHPLLSNWFSLKCWEEIVFWWREGRAESSRELAERGDIRACQATCLREIKKENERKNERTKEAGRKYRPSSAHIPRNHIIVYTSAGHNQSEKLKICSVTKGTLLEDYCPSSSRVLGVFRWPAPRPACS